MGYFGYELKADCEGDQAFPSTLPDASFILADRLIAFDHLEGCTYVVCVTDEERPGRERALDGGDQPAALRASCRNSDPGDPEETEVVEFRLSRDRETYLDDIRRCKDYLRDGDTYEVCLTNKIWTEVSPDPLPLYRNLRQVNPAPFSAFLRFGAASVLSSSPERFLSHRPRPVGGGQADQGHDPPGPHAGGGLRAREELRLSEKNRAENLMITDLLRNDLGVVCEIGTVHVPHLMEIETYETVHQLVSTIRGRLRDDVGPAEGIRACFPGGSMTGAPKKRTMEIIDELEHEPRGVYAGAIGYLGLCGGCDLNIVIRTIVMDGQSTTIGAGGAIIMQSDRAGRVRGDAPQGAGADPRDRPPGRSPRRLRRAATCRRRLRRGAVVTASGTGELVGDLLDRASEAHGERPALVHGDERLTYAALRERVDGVAGALAARGLGPGDPIAIVLPNVPAFAVAFFAVARLGGIVVPLNTQFKEAELDFAFRDSGVRAVITDARREAACGSVVAGWDASVQLFTADALARWRLGARAGRSLRRTAAATTTWSSSTRRGRPGGRSACPARTGSCARRRTASSPPRR